MGIDIRRRAVRRPTGMADSHGTRDIFAVMNQVFEDLEAPFCLDDPKGCTVINSNPSGVVTAVLQLFQALQKERCSRIAADVSYNSTHNILSIILKTSLFKRIYNIMYSKVCHYEIQILFPGLSLALLN